MSCWGPRWQRNPEAMGKNVAPRGRRFQGGVFDGFRVEDKQPWRPQNLYLSLGILMASAYRRLQHRHNFMFGPGTSGRLLGALGNLLAVLGAFEIEVFSSMGSTWAPRALLDQFWVDSGRIWENFGRIWG